jgi:hypothetical protein
MTLKLLIVQSRTLVTQASVVDVFMGGGDLSLPRTLWGLRSALMKGLRY